MSADRPSPPRGAGKAAAFIVATVAFMMVAIFVGRNIYHAETLEDQQAGHADPAERPKGPNDLQTPPQNR
ncbi:hypothetical protein [Azorhizobium]|uniref:hypothetical protein n=1 Tax=Azorhizobium TaxID=6 RepID=UPI00030CD8E5|nr:hypothetical protein [Azorhizobium]TDT99350.1 hypothetical protein DFO45_1058 [Azorhizobium sp. AG788]